MTKVDWTVYFLSVFSLLTALAVWKYNKRTTCTSSQNYKNFLYNTNNSPSPQDQWELKDLAKFAPKSTIASKSTAIHITI